MERNVGLNLIRCSIVTMVFMIGVSEATDYIVGDNFGWNVPTNESFYKDWASTKKFFVGDNLVFNFNGEHSVGVRSDATYYDNCNTSLLVDSTTFMGINGSRATYRHNIVASTGPQYFICTIGSHCDRGQKLSINVESTPDDSATSTLSFGIFYAFLYGLPLYFLTVTN